jgi:hypothetical protein
MRQTECSSCVSCRRLPEIVSRCMVFHATRAEFLAVQIRPQAETVTIHIILRSKPHVEIVLTRKRE